MKKFHTIANLLPMMSTKEFEDLKADIKKNGLADPIELYEEQILDGRNRARACHELGIEPSCKEVNPTDPVAYVISKNAHRRQLDASQKACVAVNMIPELRSKIAPTGAKIDFARKAADLIGASHRYTFEAKALKEQSESLFNDVLTGQKKLNEAVKEVKEGPKPEAASMFKDTKNGYNFFEVLSALQKAIRRGDEEEAIYWAVEFYISGNHETAWRRLFTIAVEDVGMVVPDMPANIRALYDFFYKVKSMASNKEGEPELKARKIFVQAVIVLVRAPKSRLIQWITTVGFEDHKPGRKIPDYAYDRHTKKGKQMGRGWDHFQAEGALLNNRKELEGEKEYEERAMALLKAEEV